MVPSGVIGHRLYFRPSQLTQNSKFGQDGLDGTMANPHISELVIQSSKYYVKHFILVKTFYFPLNLDLYTYLYFTLVEVRFACFM